MIHASASDLSAVAQSFKSVIKPHGLLLVDHRNPEFFRDPKNRSSSHAGHSRDVEFDFETNDIVFKMTDDSGNVNRIKGVLHPPKYLIDEFLRAGFSIADIEYDFGSRESDGSEWIHFTFIAN